MKMGARQRLLVDTVPERFGGISSAVERPREEFFVGVVILDFEAGKEDYASRASFGD